MSAAARRLPDGSVSISTEAGSLQVTYDESRQLLEQLAAMEGQTTSASTGEHPPGETKQIHLGGSVAPVADPAQE